MYLGLDVALATWYIKNNQVLYQKKGRFIMKLKVGVQLFSVMTELANDYLKTLENVAKAGYKYVEYVDVPGNSPEEIGNKVKELGLTAIASHVHFDPFTSTHEDMVKIVEDNVKMHSEAIILPMGIMTTMEEIKTVAAACMKWLLWQKHTAWLSIITTTVRNFIRI